MRITLALAAAVCGLLFAAAAAADSYRMESGAGAVGTQDITIEYSVGSDPWAPAWIVPTNARYSTVGTSKWVAPSPTGSGPAGPVHFRVKFFVPISSDASITVGYYADNYANAFVNGEPAASQPAGDIPANYGYLGAPATTFTSTNLQPGINWLTFDLYDVGNPEGLDYAGTVTYTPLTSMDQCKKSGWEDFGIFKNQGDCVSYVVTGGTNPPAGG